MEIRAFARAKDSLEGYDSESDPGGEHRPKGKAVELVDEIMWETVKGKLDADR